MGYQKLSPAPRGWGVPGGGDKKIVKVWLVIYQIQTASQWDYLLWKLMTMGKTVRGRNSFLGEPGHVDSQRYIFYRIYVMKLVK